MSKKNTKRKVIKKVRKVHIWPTLVLCLVIAVVVDGFFAFLLSAFTTYVVNSKIADEYEAVEYMAKIYDKNSSAEDDIFALLDEEGRTYFIKDNHGKIIYQFGKNTMGTTSGKIEIIGGQKSIGSGERTAIVYLDNTTEGLFVPNEDGELFINPGSIYNFAQNIQDNVSQQIDTKKASVDLPVWIAINVKGGTQTFYGKAVYNFSPSDVFFMVSMVIAAVVLLGCVIIIIVINLITTFVRHKKMTKIFFMDPITKGHNWMWFTYHGENILKKRKYASKELAVLDLVFVKYRNYCVCHSVAEGEEMLYKVDKLLKENLKKDEIACHYASANFSLILIPESKEELEGRINDLLKKLESIEIDHKFTFHVGVYLVQPEKGENGKIRKRKDIDIEREYNNACTARTTLDDCDDSGVAFFDEDLVEEQKWIDIVLDKYEDAIKNEEFLVYYQPKYDPKTRKLKGVEALIRWDSPEFGFKSPSEFIPILERNGLIPKIDKYMIRHVARDQKTWLDAGLDCVPASVNVSRAHFMEKDLANQIKNMVDSEGCPHEYLEIELTESAFFDDKKAMIDTICQLKEMGFKVSMDDFGSGYSSLNSLKDMPLDVLKLDAEFFSGDLNNSRGEIVVSEALKIAKNLEMLTVAEGVEAKAQVDFLAKNGCDMIQGFYFAKPMPRDEYATKMDDLATPEDESIAVVPDEEDEAPVGENDNVNSESNASASEETKKVDSFESASDDTEIKNDDAIVEQEPTEIHE